MKKTYVRPAMMASSIHCAANSVCGWFTQCGAQVKSNR